MIQSHECNSKPEILLLTQGEDVNKKEEHKKDTKDNNILCITDGPLETQSSLPKQDIVSQ